MKRLLIIITIFFLTGCAGLETDFSCTATATGSCQTVTEANQIGKEKTKSVKLMNKGENKTKSISTSTSVSQSAQHYVGYGIPNRTVENVHKIWIAPYVDDKDNYHKEQNIYFTNEPSKWVGFE